MNIDQHPLLRHRKPLIVVFKCVVVTLSLVVAFAVRFDFHVPAPYWQTFARIIGPVLLIKMLVFWRMGLTSGWWRYVSIHDVFVLLRANLVASCSVIAYLVVAGMFAGVPRSVMLLDALFCFLISAGARVCTRLVRESRLARRAVPDGPATSTLIVGAGNAGQMLVREIRQNGSVNKKVVGFVDDDPQKQGQHFAGVPVLGTQGDLERLCEDRNIDEIIIAIPSASNEELRAIVGRCLNTNKTFKTLPSVWDLIDNKVRLGDVRDVDVNDLLGRKPVTLAVERVRAYLKGKTVMVTGAGGSIGSELCRQVARFSPARLVLLENGETPLFHIERELCNTFPELEIVPIIGDIRDRTKVMALVERFLPQVVFHAAAYKHVPLMELNVTAAVKNNVIGTKNVADAADAFGVAHFVMISTDKAVNPTNVMGATKRTAEKYVQALAANSRTNFVTVRFGNVLGSNGSVVPIFKDQIARGGPVTVTHPEVTRFFMTIPEAVQLVLEAGSMGNGGEIFLLDMGKPVKILQLAEELIRLSGLRPHEDVEIVFTGLRPGEKLYEELLIDGEGVVETPNDKIKVARATQVDLPRMQETMAALWSMCAYEENEVVVEMLQAVVPEYVPNRDASGRLVLAEAG
ncbi:MAG TPA: nucleoside-diphosphate sugar epimerase/dehydratase [Verrucomicrobiae bacterium]|nr:nucleoside-diphosphate sugar epimerase/dehydratase [Verrucomicrobiae bacterium]